jgi:hypothetical protein
MPKPTVESEYTTPKRQHGKSKTHIQLKPEGTAIAYFGISYPGRAPSIATGRTCYSTKNSGRENSREGVPGGSQFRS